MAIIVLRTRVKPEGEDHCSHNFKGNCTIVIIKSTLLVSTILLNYSYISLVTCRE